MKNREEISPKRERKSITTYQLTMLGLMTALLCILGPVSIPISEGVPFSFTNLVIYLMVYLLGGRNGTICVGLYLLIGGIGLPVFSSYGGGIGKLLGPTGGYLIGFIFMAAICGIFLKAGKRNIWIYLLGMVLATLVTYTFGSLWFMFDQKRNLMQTLSVCVFPFLIGDGMKIAAITIIAPLIHKRLVKAGVL